MTVHAMIDYETLAVSSFPVLLSGAMVLFDPDGDAVSVENARFSFISISDCLRLGMELNPDTLAWWMDPARDAARPAAFWSPGNARSMHPIVSVSKFIKTICDGLAAHKVEAIWSHGLAFDVAITLRAAEAVGDRLPFHYRAPRDTRTLFELVPDLAEPTKPDDFVEHDPVWDCWRQARMVQMARAQLREWRLCYDNGVVQLSDA